MKKYPKYKPSGVDWLGDIPSNWNCKILKRITKFAYGDSLSDENRNGGKVPVYGSNGIVGFHDNAITKAPCIIVGRKGSYGRINYSEKACFPIDTSYFIDSTQTKCDLKWLMYFLSILRLDENTLDDTVPGLSREWAYRMPSLILSSPEQKSIVRFLDYKTGQIDSFIANRQTHIKLLKEEKAGIINKAITKGINPDAKMKPSGIEWIGDIPEHWSFEKLKFKAKIQFSNVDKLSEENEKPILLCNYIDVYKNEFIDDSIEFMQATATDSEIQKFIIEVGDIIITKDSEDPEDIAIPALVIKKFKNVLCGYHLAQIRVRREIFLPEFLLRLFQSYGFNSNFRYSATGMTRYGISVSSIKNVFVPIPQKKEQEHILDYIKTETATIDNLISKYQKQIDLMQEYRTSLISQAVTGKIDVRDWQPKKKVKAP